MGVDISDSLMKRKLPSFFFEKNTFALRPRTFSVPRGVADVDPSAAFLLRQTLQPGAHLALWWHGGEGAAVRPPPQKRRHSACPLSFVRLAHFALNGTTIFSHIPLSCLKFFLGLFALYEDENSYLTDRLSFYVLICFQCISLVVFILLLCVFAFLKWKYVIDWPGNF